MAKIDKVKEILNSLRVGLYKNAEINILFYIVSILFFGFLLAGFVIIHKIRIKTNELEKL